MRRDKAFSRQTILDAMPGTGAAIVKASGYSAAAVSRHVAALVAENLAYQSGWHEGRPVYAAGSRPRGFKLPAKPDLAKARAARYKRARRARDEAYRAKDNERRRRNDKRTPKGPPDAETLSRAGKAGALARWGDKRAKDAAFVNTLLQLIKPK